MYHLLTCVGAIWLLSVIEHLYLIGEWFSEYQRTNILMTHVYIQKLDQVSSFYQLSTPYSIVDNVDWETEHMYWVEESPNMYFQ
jgi:hypothetical protein